MSGAQPELFNGYTHRCDSCGAPIVFVRTASNAKMPCDAKSHNFITLKGQVLRGRVVHWETCPNADEHRGAGSEKEKRG